MVARDPLGAARRTATSPARRSGTIPTGPNALRVSDRHDRRCCAPAGCRTRSSPTRCDLLPLYAARPPTRRALLRRAHDAPRRASATSREIGEYFAALPAERFPNIVALAGPLVARGEGDERFEFGLDVLVAGLAAYGRRASS